MNAMFVLFTNLYPQKIREWRVNSFLYGHQEILYMETVENISKQAKEIQDIYKKSYLGCQLFMSNFIPYPDGRVKNIKHCHLQIF